MAAAVLQRSPALTDADLVDCATTGDVVAQTVLARRPNLPHGVTAALAEVGQLDAVLALIGNVDSIFRRNCCIAFFRASTTK